MELSGVGVMNALGDDDDNGNKTTKVGECQ